MDFDLKEFAITVVRTMSDAVIYSDAEGIIRWWNDGAASMFGYSAEEAVGQSLDIIIPENLRARHWEGYRRTLETGQSYYGAGDLLAVPAITKDGTRISVEFTVIPFHDANQRMAGIAAVMRDVTKAFNEKRELRKKLASYTAAEARG